MSEAPDSQKSSTSQMDGQNLSLEDRFPFLKDETGKKRVRTLLTQEQAEVLQSILAQTPFPSTSVREAAARELGISPRKVQVWFQNVRQKHRRLGGNILKCARRYQSLPRGQPSIAARPQATRQHSSPSIEDVRRDLQGTDGRRQQQQHRSAAGSIDRRYASFEELEAGMPDQLNLTQTLQDKLALQSPPSTIIEQQRNDEDKRLPALDFPAPAPLTRHRAQSGGAHIVVPSDPLRMPYEGSRRFDLGRPLPSALRPSASHLSAFSFPPPKAQLRRSHEAPPHDTYQRLDVPSPTRPRAGTVAYGALRGRRAFDLVRMGLPLQHPSACPPLRMQRGSGSELSARGSRPTHERQQLSGPYEIRRSTVSSSRPALLKSLSSCGLQTMSSRRDFKEAASRGSGQIGRSHGSLSSLGVACSSLPSLQGLQSSTRRRSDVSEDFVRPTFLPMQTSDRIHSTHLPHSTSPFSSLSIGQRQRSDSRVSHYRGESICSALSAASLPFGLQTVESSLVSFSGPTVESPEEDQSMDEAADKETLAQQSLDMGQLQQALSDVPQFIKIQEQEHGHKAAARQYGHRHVSSSYRSAEGVEGFPGYNRSPFGSFSGILEANKILSSERGQAESQDHSPYSLPARSPSMSPPHQTAYGARSRSMSLLSLEEEDALTLPPILSLLTGVDEDGSMAGKPWKEFAEQRQGEGEGHAAKVCKLPGIAHLISPRSL